MALAASAVCHCSFVARRVSLLATTFDDDRLLRQSTFAQNLRIYFFKNYFQVDILIILYLEESGPGDVDDSGLFGVFGVLLPRLFRNQRPQFVDIDGGAKLVRLVRVHVEVPHTDLSLLNIKYLYSFAFKQTQFPTLTWAKFV